MLGAYYGISQHRAVLPTLCSFIPTPSLTLMEVSAAVAPPLAQKVLLLYAMRDAALCQLTTATGVSQQGLSQAARQAKRARLLSPAECNKLISLDYSYNLIRHLTTPRMNQFLAMIATSLDQNRSHAPSQTCLCFRSCSTCTSTL